MLKLAHGHSVTSAGAERNRLVERYAEAIRSYLLALVKNRHDAEDLAQSMVVKMLDGDFAGATPDRGRFRDFLKAAVRNMARNYWKAQNRAQKTKEMPESPRSETDDDWTQVWRKAVLKKTWVALRTEGPIHYTVLRLRVDSPDDSSTELAEKLSSKIGRTISPEATRQQLRRARQRFAKLLVEELARSVNNPTPETVESELSELGLKVYVLDFLD